MKMTMMCKQEISIDQIRIVAGGIHHPPIKLPHFSPTRSLTPNGPLDKKEPLNVTAPLSKTGS